MKKSIGLIIAAALLAVGCRKELHKPSPDMASTVICAEASGTRTYLDGLEVCWSEDDAIVANGSISSSITIGARPSSAEFAFGKVLSSPFYCLYPSSAYVEGSFNPSNGEYGTLDIPSVQTYVPGSFDRNAACMVGVSSGEDPGSVSFSHAMAYLEFTVRGTSDADAIKKIVISARGGENLSGEFAFNPSTMSLECASKDGNTVSIVDLSGVPQGTPLIVAVPAQTYSSGINVRIIDVKNHYQDIKSSKSFEAAAGKIYRTTLSFNPTGTLVDSDTGTAGGADVTKVLFIGNSHTLDATDLLPLMLNAQGVKNVEFTRVYHGGYWLQGYNTNYAKAKNCSIMTWRPGQQRWRGYTTLDYALKDAVEAEKYDIVVMQEYAGHSTCWTWNNAERDAVNGLVSKIRASSPSARFFYMLSHCFAKGYSVLMDSFDNSNDAQFRCCVENNGKHIADPSEGFPFERIISTGALVQNLRTTGLNLDNGCDLLRGDGVHLDYGMTRMAASLLIWKTIITPLTGIQPEDVKFRQKEYYPSTSIRTTPVTDETFPTLIAAVNAAYDKPLEITEMSSYSSVPQYEDAPGATFLDETGVEVEPCTFPVNFNLGYRAGVAEVNHQAYWNPFGVWQATQQQAYMKWVSVSTPVKGLLYQRTSANSSASNISTPALNGVWTGDYFEIVIPVRDFRAGTTVRMQAPFYTRQGPCFWYLDYYDGGEWKCNHSTLTAWAGDVSRDASIAINYGTTPVTYDFTFENPVPSGTLRFRIRCADGGVQAAENGAVVRDTPYISNGAYGSVFYFRDAKQISFSIVK